MHAAATGKCALSNGDMHPGFCHLLFMTDWQSSKRCNSIQYSNIFKGHKVKTPQLFALKSQAESSGIQVSCKSSLTANKSKSRVHSKDTYAILHPEMSSSNVPSTGTI